MSSIYFLGNNTSYISIPDAAALNLKHKISLWNGFNIRPTLTHSREFSKKELIQQVPP